MQPNELRLLIHHHHLAYLDKDGVIWLFADIGRWAEALADHFGEVGLLLYQSEHKLPQQDTPIARGNVRLYSLGARGTVWKRIFRRNRLRQVCAAAGKNADILLIRGITPHQFPVWRFTPAARKAFLLMESPSLRTKHIPISPGNLLALFLGYYRLNELRQIANSGTLLLANSPAVVSEIEQTLNRRAIFAPTTSIRRSEFSTLQVRPVLNEWKLLYCGRLDHKKGLRELIRALALLSLQGQPCRLDVAGAMIDPVYSELLQLANALGVGHLITWHGFVPFGSELFAFYQRADVFVLPTYSEGFPFVFWEAAANCCPVITTSVGGIPGLLVHEKHALLIPPRDVDAIVMAVKRLLSDDPLRRNLVEQAYLYALDFSVEACARRMADILSKEWS